MHPAVLALHSIVRWLVILTGLVAVLRCYRGLFTNAPWTPRENVSLRAFVFLFDAQVLLGLILYFVSPVTRQAFGAFGPAMRDSAVRYFVVEHPLAMLLAVALAHVALARTRKAATDGGRYRAAAALLTLSFVLVLAMTPWGRALFPSF